MLQKKWRAAVCHCLLFRFIVDKDVLVTFGEKITHGRSHFVKVTFFASPQVTIGPFLWFLLMSTRVVSAYHRDLTSVSPGEVRLRSLIFLGNEDSNGSQSSTLQVAEGLVKDRVSSWLTALGPTYRH